MRTGKGVVTLPPEGRWGEMAAFGFPHRLRNRGLLCPPRLMRKRTSLCPSFDALGRGTKVLVFLGWVRYQMVDVRAVRVSTHLSLFRSPCRSICEPKQKGESDGSCRFHIQRLFFPAPSPSPLPASFCLSLGAYSLNGRGRATGKTRISRQPRGIIQSDGELLTIRLRRR